MRPSKGVKCVSFSFLLFLITLVVEPSSGQDIGALGSGVVVERVLQHSESEKAGIQEGDVLLRWARGDVHGEIQLPFDLNAAGIEQAPRGDVMLEGLRGKEKRTWQLGQDRWGLQVRPNFPDAILALYREGQDLAAAGKLSEAAEKWRLIINRQDSSNPQWLRAWLLVHLAGLQAEARNWTESDQAYREALEISRAEPGARAQIHLDWGRTFIQRNDWEHAVEHFNQAMAAEQTLGNDSLALATIFDELGGLAQKQGDLSKAEGHYEQALRMREHLAPVSLAMATSLNHLGAIAKQRSKLEEAEDFAQRALAMAEKTAPHSLPLAGALGNLGDVALDRSRLDEAEQYYRRSLSIYEALANGNLDLAWAFQRLGWIAWKRSDFAKAEEYYKHALAIREKLAPGSLDFAMSFNSLGNVLWERGDLAKAEEYFKEALAIQEKLAPGSLSVAMSFDSLGSLAWKKWGDLASAEEYYKQGLAIQDKLAPGSLGVARSFDSLGRVLWRRGDLAKAEEYVKQALAIREKLAPGSLDVATSSNSLGIVAWQRGDLTLAEEYYKRALAIQEKLVPGSLDVALSFVCLGVVAWQRSDLARAEEYHKEALAIQEKLAPGSPDVAASFNNLGIVAWQRGDLARAEEYYKRALAIQEKLAPGSLDAAQSFVNLGIVARQRGDLARAEEYDKQALAIQEKLAPGSPDVAASLNNLGVVVRERGNRVEAEKDYRQALSIREKLAPFSVDMALNLNDLAQLVEDRGALEEAEQSYRKASAILDQLAPGSADLADSLAGVASIRRRQGRLEEAAQFYAQALDAFEAQTARLGGATAIRADFRAKRGDYREYMNVLLAEGKPEAAFEVLERSRARILLEVLASAHVDIRRGVSPALIKKERSLQADIKAKSERRVHLLSEKQSEVQVKAVEKEISALTAEYEDVEAQVRSNSPAYAALTEPQPLSAKEIQQQLLEADTVLLEYSLEEPRSHVFMVSSSSLEAFALPKRGVIEAASRQVYELLTARNRRPKGEKPADRIARIARADSEFPHAAAKLSRMVLGPVAAKLANKRLLIVSDGALNYVPFAALPIAAPDQAAIPLAARHEIVNLPSGSVLAVLRRERQGRSVAAKTVAVLADPVFDSGDVRVKQSLAAGSRQNAEPQRDQAASQTVPAGLQDTAAQKDGARNAVAERSDNPTAASSTTQAAAIVQGVPANTEAEESLETARLTRSSSDVGWKRAHRGEVYLPRLQSTRREAEAIVSIAPAGQSFEALDFEANRATASSAQLENYRIVHFATHALLNSKHPELSGLVLSLVNERGQPQSGFLGLEDIYNLNLPVELVVLSACETALGKAVEGEGMVGLTRGFMYAGASRVVASLWNINDQATSVQMGHFYRAMLGQGMRPAAALRTAQLKLRQEPRWKSPYFWAAFQIQGEWK